MNPTSHGGAPDEVIDPTVRCSACEAVCCRLTVMLMPGDQPPRQFVTRDGHGMEVMRQNEDGWCAALDMNAMRCTIYEQRPGVCRDVAMGGSSCLEERAIWYRGT